MSFCVIERLFHNSNKQNLKKEILSSLGNIKVRGEKRMKMAVVVNVILTVGDIIALWPATAFLLQYFNDAQDSDALTVGGFFSVLAVVLLVSLGWGLV
jgi:hypothetical protein